MSSAMKAAGPTDLTRNIAGSLDQTALTSAKLTSASKTSTLEGSRTGDALVIWASTIGPPDVAGSTVLNQALSLGSSPLKVARTCAYRASAATQWRYNVSSVPAWSTMRPTVGMSTADRRRHHPANVTPAPAPAR